jgi:hypothetical protein
MSISQISSSSTAFAVNITIPKTYKYNKNNNSRLHSSLNTPIKSNNDSIYKTPIKLITSPSPMKLNFINDISFNASEYMISPSNLVLSLSSISKENSSPYDQTINETIPLTQLIKDIDVNNKDNYYNGTKGYNMSPFKFLYQSHSDLNEVIKISTPLKKLNSTEMLNKTSINDDVARDTSDIDDYDSMEIYSITYTSSNFEFLDQVANANSNNNGMDTTWEYRDGNSTIPLDLKDHYSISNGLNSIDSKILSNTVTVNSIKKSNNNNNKISMLDDVIVDANNKNIVNVSLFDQFIEENNIANNTKLEKTKPTTNNNNKKEEIKSESTMETKTKMSRNDILKERRKRNNMIQINNNINDDIHSSNNIVSLNEKEIDEEMDMINDNMNIKNYHEKKQVSNSNEIEKDLLNLKNDMFMKSNEILERLKNKIENKIDNKINVKSSVYSNPNYNFIKYIRTDDGVQIHHSLSVNPPKELKDNNKYLSQITKLNNNNNEIDNNNFDRFYLSVIFILIGILSSIGIKKSSLYFSNVYSISIENYLRNAELNAINLMTSNNYIDAKRIVEDACILIRKEKGID